MFSMRAAALAALAAAVSVRADPQPRPRVTPLTVGIELEVGDVAMANYAPNGAAGYAYAPTWYQQPIVDSKGESSVPGMPLWSVTVDGNKGHYPTDATGNAAAFTETAMNAHFGGEWDTFNGIMEIEGGPIDINDEKRFTRQLAHMQRFVGEVARAVKCTQVTKHKKFLHKTTKTFVDDAAGVTMLQLVSGAPNVRYERGFPLSEFVDDYNSLDDVKGDFQLKAPYSWADVARDKYGDDEFDTPTGAFHSGPHPHVPYLFCRNREEPKKPQPSAQVNFVVPLAKWGYDIPATNAEHSPIGKVFGLPTVANSMQYAAALHAATTAGPLLFTGAHAFLWDVPEVRGLLAFGLYTAVKRAHAEVAEEQQVEARKKRIIAERGLGADEAHRLAQEQVDAAPDAGKNIYGAAMMKTCPPDYSRALPPKVKAALAAWGLSTTKDNFVGAVYGPLDAKLLERNPDFGDGVTVQYRNCPKKKDDDDDTWCQLHLQHALYQLYKETFRPSTKLQRYSNAGETDLAFGDLRVRRPAPYTRGAVVRTTPLRLQGTPHLMVLLEQRQGSFNSAVTFHAGDEASTSAGLMDYFRTTVKKYMVPYLPPCPAADNAVHDACKTNTFAFTAGNNKAKSTAKAGVISHAYGTVHVCMAPEEQLVATTPAAKAALESDNHDGWPHYLGMCSVGTVAHVMYQA